ncbi:MAG TPA: L,D-transpeptidase [Roseiarcus sp.]|nr:L,D-transpeptidase [Roseiarcus sp.]
MKLLLAFDVILAAESRASALVQIDVDLASQTMQVRSGSGETHAWPISSGTEGHATPRGCSGRALYMMVHSAKYGNAPMPHSIFFYEQYAIHGTNAVGSLGRTASHGCIRLLPGNAAVLFAMVQSQGARIRIVGTAPRSGELAHARRAHKSDSALACAPVHRSKTLNEWARALIRFPAE